MASFKSRGHGSAGDNIWFCDKLSKRVNYTDGNDNECDKLAKKRKPSHWLFFYKSWCLELIHLFSIVEYNTILTQAILTW